MFTSEVQFGHAGACANARKKTKTYNVGNPSPGLGQPQCDKESP
jgi:hypothetical protein